MEARTVDYSRECDYDKCDYKCDNITVELPENEITHNIYYSKLRSL